MAPSDRALGKLSSAFTLVLLAGILAVPFLPMRHIERNSAVPQPSQTVPPTTRPVDRNAGAEPDADHHEAADAEQTSSDEDAKTEDLVVWTDQEQAAALRSCVKLLAPLSVKVEMAEPMRKGECGSAAPVMLQSIGDAGRVTFDPPPKMNCRLAAALARWVETVLQPAAREVLGSRITEIMGASSYACRTVYNLPNRRLSEHATGNAIDIAAFSTADGRTIRVLSGWGPTERDIVAARKKLEEAKKAEAAEKGKSKGGKSEENAKPDDDGDKDAKSGTSGVQKANLSRSREKPVPAAATLTAAKTAQSAFLKRLHHGACGVFATVLGPEANEAHRNHFHFDMKQRGSSRRYCH